MTIRESYIKKDFFAPRFFLNTLKKSWTNFLLYFIICFFSFPVPILISTGSSYYRESATVKFEYIVERVLNMLEDLNVISVFVAAAIAVFAGCVATRYLNSKTSTYFYHSLPVTREALYFARVLVGVINYVLAHLLSILIGALVILLRIGASSQIAVAFLTIVGYSLLVFFTIFFITVFVGAFCGTTGVQFIMTGTLLFILPATLTSALFLADEYMRYIDVNWYLENIVLYTSPALRLFWLYDKPLSILEIVLFALSALVFAFLALLVYRRRPNENAENPIVFSGASTFLKYAIMIPATIAMGIWFGEMGGGLWRIFGFAAGAVLTFMLLNAVFHKNARAIFSGVRGLIVFFVAFAVCFLATVFDVLKLDEYVPGDNLVSRVEVNINGQNYGKYESDDVLKSLKNDLKRYMKDREDMSVDTPYDGIGYAVVEIDKAYDYEVKKEVVCRDSLSVEVVYYTKLGMPVAKYYSNIPKPYFTSTLKAIADSDEFEKTFYDFLFYAGVNPYENITLQRIDGLRDYKYKYGLHNSDALSKAYQTDMGDINYESFQYPEVGEVFKRVRVGTNYSNSRFSFPLLINCRNFFDMLLEGDDIYGIYLDSIHSVNVYRTLDDKEENAEMRKITFTDKSDIEKILSSVANATDNYATNVFCEYDYRYFVEIRYYSDATVQKEDGKYLFDEDWIGPVSYFIKGKVPAFIENELK